MHPRKLAPNDGPCSGGTCPAVYDEMAELPGKLVIQGQQADADLLATLTGLADDENAVIIDRDIVKAALRPVLEHIGLAELQAQIEAFSWSAFRLETLQSYTGTGRDDQWISLLKRSRRWGKTHQRVHVVTEPLTPAMQQELTEGYEGNVAAGEDIRIVSVAGPGEWPDGLHCPDFWLFDSSRLYVMRYEWDGSWVGADRIHDPESVVKACQVRDQALHDGMPWRDYIATRPELQQRLAQ
jgi:hypothetical protein